MGFGLLTLDPSMFKGFLQSLCSESDFPPDPVAETQIKT